ncbi:hypothetical protein AAHZ94_03480 [Streptomyces sp. HSW2009]|uniref:hypothetical protein n=1 Tax=Streptomyces sp. HSW2009 TaxID=3142890 RepID=UPI0032EF2D01
MRTSLRTISLVIIGGTMAVGCGNNAESPPDLAPQKGQVLGAAQEQARLAGLSSSAHDATESDRAPRADWSVCFQSQQKKSVEFAAVHKAEPCPDKDGNPVPWLKMPKVTGLTVSGARSALADVEKSLTKGSRLVGARPGVNPYANPADGEPDSWLVCSQQPAIGTALDSRWQAEEEIELHVIQPGIPCP